MKIKIFEFLLLVFVAATLLSVVCSGTEIAIPDGDMEALRDSLPPEVADKLPDGTLDGSEGFFEGVEQMSGGEYIVSVISDALGVGLGEGATLLLGLLCAVTFAAVTGSVAQGIGGSALQSPMRIIGAAALTSVTLYSLYSHFSMLEDFFEKLWTMLGAMIPITAGVWAMGGNVTTAASGSAWFYVMLNVCQTLIAKSVVPVCGVLAVLGACEAASDEVRIGKMLNAIKKIYNFVLGFIMTLLLAFLATQTSLCASADTVSARSARLMSGTLIPVVGGSVGETFRTLAGGVSYLKNLFGIGSIVMIGLLTLPIGATLLLTRFAFLISAGIADMLGCSSEARFLEGFGEVYGIMLGALTVVSVTFVLGLCIFMQTVVAVA